MRRHRPSITPPARSPSIVPPPEGTITGGDDDKTARTVASDEGDTLNATALRTMFEQIIANSRAGGWRRLKRQA